MAKFIEVVSGKYKGLRCFVRTAKMEDDFYQTFDNTLLKKTDCKVLEYEKNWVGEKDPGCRYRE
ncbi:MAG TPA: hypothetical protein VD908_09540 [Cytophagales bacterium]|nr:hypothetical protein [Cytophagales bacterium]